MSCPILDATNRVEYGGRIPASPTKLQSKQAQSSKDYWLKVSIPPKLRGAVLGFPLDLIVGPYFPLPCQPNRLKFLCVL